MITLRPVTPLELETDIERVNGWMVRLSGNSFGEFTAEQMFDYMNSRSYLLLYYCLDDEPIGLVICTQIQYPNARTLVVVGAAGASEGEWLPASEVLKELARSLGCTKLEAKGRKGWAKVFEKQGWKEKYRTIGIDSGL